MFIKPPHVKKKQCISRASKNEDNEIAIQWKYKQEDGTYIYISYNIVVGLTLTSIFTKLTIEINYIQAKFGKQVNWIYNHNINKVYIKISLQIYQMATTPKIGDPSFYQKNCFFIF